MSAAEDMGGADAVKLPYRFAREFGLALSQTEKGVTLHIGSAANRQMIAEVARSHDIAEVEEVSQERFDDLLSELYARRSFEEDSEQADAERLDDDFDAIVQGVEHSADLLAGDDDAPVIRLLNSLLSEAVRSGA